ncbi:hypothetical protein C8D92_107167 [Tamilnaduibacter salinus]|uniref:ApbE family protein n=1 Tax=Tamilnaduibacter salinus TaxID=1484056 RepID=A0A2U1CVK0_9GAMM|nr:(Na+)-NQR maturation NqrM [Tamilnaduibacter salinus]PVY75444.1 hypothetical protein C8D92_107167 [Tamilnaduibacter salinus]
MSTFLLALGLVAFLLLGMSIGVIMGRKPISGSCGGMSALGMDTACDVCGGDQKKCEKENAGHGGADDEPLAYDATKQD